MLSRPCLCSSWGMLVNGGTKLVVRSPLGPRLWKSWKWNFHTVGVRVHNEFESLAPHVTLFLYLTLFYNYNINRWTFNLKKLFRFTEIASVSKGTSLLKRKTRDSEMKEDLQLEKKYAPAAKFKVPERCSFCRSKSHKMPRECPSFKRKQKESEQIKLGKKLMIKQKEDVPMNIEIIHEETEDRQSRIIDDMIKEYPDLFKSARDRPLIQEIEHCIETGNILPVCLTPHTYSPNSVVLLKKTVEYMLHREVIEECESPWAAAHAVIVPTEDGRSRCSIDFRALNRATEADPYQMPTIEDLRQEYAMHNSQAKYMATLSLPSDKNWQIPIRKQDRPKTAFVTPFGTYMFRVMPPVDLRNNAVTSQKLVDKIKASLPPGRRIMAINDTFVILAESLDEYVDNLRQLLQKLQKFQVSLERDCLKEVLHFDYLGHLVTLSGISSNYRDKTRAIRKLSPPTSTEQLDLLINTCFGYAASGLVTGLEEIAEPLMRLLMKDITWSWGNVEQNAFSTLKRLLVESPVFWRQSDPSRPYTVHTAASGQSIGSILVQVHGERNSEHPIEYASRSLTPEEQDYPTTKKKALAVIWAVNKFCDYLNGASGKVTVTTDHEPLRWLMSLRASSGMPVDCFMMIQSFDLDIQYLPADSYTRVVDLLVGGLQEPEETDIFGTSCIELPARSAKETQLAQLKDNHLRKIIEAFEVNKDFYRYTSMGYIVSRGLLYKYTNTEEPQLVVPESEQNSVIRTYHDDTHCGPEETANRISEKYFWIGLKNQVISYLKSCTECKASKKKHSTRFSETLVVELFGPLPRDCDGNCWVLVVEDFASGWVELFAMKESNLESCAKILTHEVFMRYGVPKQIVLENPNGIEMGNGIKKILFCLKIKLNSTVEVNVQRKNKKNTKAQLIMLVKGHKKDWSSRLPNVRFVLNAAPAQVCFGHELRSPPKKLKKMVNAERSVPEIDRELLRLADTLRQSKEIYEKTSKQVSESERQR